MLPKPVWNDKNNFLISIAISILVAACSAQPVTSKIRSEKSEHWSRAFDLDGDGKIDWIEVKYSGGAHCCYRLTVHLTSSGKVYKLPFQLDGGYLGGLDLSRPNHFDIRKTDGLLPEMVMEIETDNAKPQELPKEWKRQYEITTHYVAVEFPNGRLRIRDWPRKR